MVITVRDRLETLFEESAYDFEESGSSGKPFTDVLLDISRYECDELVQGSLHLLNRFFSAELALFDSAVQTQLLCTKESAEVSASTFSSSVVYMYIIYMYMYVHEHLYRNQTYATCSSLTLDACVQ